MATLCVPSFRHQQCFYGVNLSSLRGAAVDEYFRQPIVVSAFRSRLSFPPCVHLSICSLTRSLAHASGRHRAARLCEAGTEEKKELLGALCF